MLKSFSLGLAALIMFCGHAFAAQPMSPPFSNALSPSTAKTSSGSSGGREILTADTDYYISTTGSDTTGNGSVSLPWATIQKAMDVVFDTKDLYGFDVVIHVADGTYTTPVSVSGALVGKGSVSIECNVTTPSNCLMNVTNTAFSASDYAQFSVKGFKVVSSAGSGVYATAGAKIVVDGNMEYGACAIRHLYVSNYGQIYVTADYSITGNAMQHYVAEGFGYLSVSPALTITITGTPAFSHFSLVTGISQLIAYGSVYLGGATGMRYLGSHSSLIYVGGGGANYFPGDVAGSVNTNAVYQ